MIAILFALLAAVAAQTTRLEPGRPVEREIAGGEQHSYSIRLGEGELLTVVVEQRGADLILELLDGRGQSLKTVDSYNSTFGPERLSYLAAGAGEYRLEIRGFKKHWNPTRYTVAWHPSPSPSGSDRQRLVAEELEQEARGLFNENKIPSRRVAVQRLEAANAIWRELEDAYRDAETTQTIGYYRQQLGDASAAGTLDRALTLWRRVGDRHGECRTLNSIGNLYYAQSANDKALAAYERAAASCQSAADTYEQGVVYSNVADLYFYKTQNYRRSAAFYLKALSRWQQVGDREREADAVNSAGASYYRLKEDDKALEFFQRALALEQRLDRPGRLALFSNNLGDTFYRREEFEHALEQYQASLAAARRANETTRVVTALRNLAAASKQLDRLEDAAGFYNQLLAIHRDSGDTRKQADVLNDIGLMYWWADKYSRALEYHRQALAVIPADDHTEFAATLHINVGDCLYRLDQYRAALEEFDVALQIRRELGDKDGQAEVFNRIGSVLIQLDEYQGAVENYERALALFRETGDRRNEAESLHGLGTVYASQGQARRARQLFREALALYESTGDKTGQSDALRSIGEAYEFLDERDTALEYFERALTITRSVEDRGGEATILNNIGDIHYFRNEFDRALERYNAALGLNRDVEDRNGEAGTLQNIGKVHEARAEYQRALELYRRALETNEAILNRAGTVNALSAIGDIYQSLGEYRQALEYYQQVLTVAEETGLKADAAGALLDIATVHYHLDEFQQSLDHSNRALALVRAMEDRQAESRALNLISLVYDDLGQGEARNSPAREQYFQRALDSYRQSLDIDRAIGNLSGVATVLGNIGVNYYYRDRYDEALEYLEQSLELKHQLGNIRGEATTRYWIARMMRAQQKYAEALPQIERGIAILESIRSRMSNQEMRTSYFASVSNHYELYIDVLMQLEKAQPGAGLAARALEASERARARALLETLSEAQADIRQGVSAELLGRERQLQRQLNAKAQEQMQPLGGDRNAEWARKIAKEIEALTAEYQELQAQIRQASPRYAALTQPQARSLTEIQADVVDSDTVLLEYALGAQRSYLWSVTPTSMTSYELPGRSEIEALARQAYAWFTNAKSSMPARDGGDRGLAIAGANAATFESATHLSRILLGPVASQLGGKRLLIVANGALQFIPFSALPIPEGDNVRRYRAIVEEHEIVSAPSASTVILLRRENRDGRQPSRTVAVLADPVFERADTRLGSAGRPVGDSGLPLVVEQSARESGLRDTGLGLPRLPYTRDEAERILSLVPEAERRQALDFEANVETATDPDLGRYRFVHFATHGFLDPVHPELSGIVLSMFDAQGTARDGFLRMHEVFNLRLSADMVVLSACQTGLGKDVRGEGLLGLTRGFMYAGAPRVVVSLWSVNDEATAELMKRFYAGILGERRLRPAQALQEAQRSMLTDARFSSPFYWAAFTLAGEWR